MAGLELAVDFGTSNTVAVLRWPDGRSQALLFDGSPVLPSAVFLGADGQALTGRHAQRSARTDPARYEPNPKRCIDDGTVLLGETALPVVGLIAVVLRRVVTEAVRVGGAPPTRTVLTHPVAWGPQRRGILLAAAAEAGLDPLVLVAEPLAAAAYFTRVLAQPVPVGCALVVYDFGGGTFDVSVVQREPDDGWRVLASDGLTDVGGIDLDDVVVEQVGNVVAGTDAAGWRRLIEPRTATERRYRRLLLDDAREAKEHLSLAAKAPVHVPLLDTETYVTRDEFERHARPWLDRTIALTATTVSAAGVPANRIAGVFLVGGASRIPLVATLLHRQFAVAPTAIEQPELVVAQGALHAADLAPTAPPPTPAPPTTPVPPPAPARSTTTPTPDATRGGSPAPMTSGSPPIAAADPTAPTGPWPARNRSNAKIGMMFAAAAAVIVLAVAALANLPGAGSNSRATGGPSASTSSACEQPDTNTGGVGNREMFCSAALKQLAEPWLGSTHCSVPNSGPSAKETVSCEQQNWTVRFTMCAGGAHNCPEHVQQMQSDGAKVSSTVHYTAKGIAGTRTVGTTDGVPFVYWDSDTSAASAELESKSFNGAPFASEQDLLGIWQRYTS